MADRSNDLVFTLKDGREVETSFLPPYSTAEQIAFEEKFRCSFLAVEQAAAEMRRAAEAADGPDATIDPAQAFQVRWILWFGWRRARPKVASKFQAFVEEQLEDWGFKAQPKAELEKPEDDDVIDAEVVTEGATGDPLIDQMDHEQALEDGRLDPTPEPQPA
jgi:hypothetical protein